MIEMKIEIDPQMMIDTIYEECDYDEKTELLRRFMVDYIEEYFHESTIDGNLTKIESIIKEAREELID